MNLGKGIKRLLPHEKKLILSGELKNITHNNSSSIWLETSSSKPSIDYINVYRVMGDIELQYLMEHNNLPDTQPYQAIMEDEKGRIYAEKYLNGQKWVDSCPTTVVEFIIPRVLRDQLFAIQHKAEDGVLSMGLGNKAGKGLGIFNESLSQGLSKWQIVKVKRSMAK